MVEMYLELVISNNGDKGRLELVKNHVLESHLKDIFCLLMYALVTLAHIRKYDDVLPFMT